ASNHKHTTRVMNHDVHRALEAGLKAYGNVAGYESSGLLTRLGQVFDAAIPYLEKVSKLDAAFDDYPSFEELREVTFDLLLMNFFADDVKKLEEDYLESAEWEAIEEQTIDRGTEVL